MKSGKRKVRERMTKVRVRGALSIATVLLSTTILMATAPQAQAYALEGPHWGSSTVYVEDFIWYSMDSSASGSIDAAFKAAISDYYAKTHLYIYGGDYSTAGFRASAANFGATGWEGQTGFTYLGSRFMSVESRLNAYYLPNSTNQTRLKMVWLHELGHGLGLDHVSTLTDPMQPNASDAYSRGVTTLSQDMVNGINSMY